MFILIRDNLKFKDINFEKIHECSIYDGIDILNIEGIFHIVLKDKYHFEDGSLRKILECKKYVIKQKELFRDIDVFVYENNEGINDFELYEKENILCANHTKANILNKDLYMANYYFYLNGNHIETNYDSLLVNDKKFNSKLNLQDGDIIRFQNIIIILFNGYLYINRFMNDCLLKKAFVKEEVFKYGNNKPILNNGFYIDNKQLEIPDIEEFKGFKKVEKKSILFQIGPSITMSFTMIGMAIINVYNNQQNNGSTLNSVIYLMMPITMLLSGILWPLLTNLNEKKKINDENETIKNNYLDYLDNYLEKTKELINEYIKNENEYYIDSYNKEDNLFSITSKSKRFLNISIGKTSLKKEIRLKRINNEEIDEKINIIEKTINNISDVPYYINVLDYQRISIVCNESKEKIIKQYLYELSIKYNYHEFYLGIYSEDINKFNEFFGMPQLIFNNKRLTFNNSSDLQEVNNYKLNKPLVLFICDKTDFEFTNKEINILYFSKDINDIYINSSLLIEYQKNFGFVYEENKTPFKYEILNKDYKKINDILSGFQEINFTSKETSFRDINKEINIEEDYKKNQIGLKADFATIGNEVLSFDLHESKQGPHGLIGGSTGSGKSELIISLLLSLCLRYRPDYLNIILIDYKGGGIKESLTYDKKVIPHIVASVDNLQSDTFDRLMIAIDYECKRRQKLFKILSNNSGNSIMNIDDYLNNDYKNYDLPPIAHLLIVVDEFAELKKENGEIIKELVSFSRIGRSLGIHLILATQRPSGIIDDEIWSNSHFKIALKVFNEKDSNDIIKSKDAAYLNNPGEFYLSVEDNLQKAKSIYSKKDINDKDNIEISLLDNKLTISKQKVIRNQKTYTEASFIVKKILDATKSLNITTSEIRFNKLKQLSRKELNIKYFETNDIVLGEVDDYINFSYKLLTVSSNDNIFIFSTRNNEINTVINNLTKRTIIIGKNKYENSFISDSLIYDEIDDIKYLFEKLINENNQITVLIEDLSCLLAYDDTINSNIYQLLRKSSSSNVNIIAISKISLINIKLLNAFKYKFAIEINERQDLLNIFGTYSRYKGESFFFEEELKSFAPTIIEEYKQSTCFINPYIKHIPQIIKYKKNINGILLGVDVETRKEIYLSENDKLLISSYDEETIKLYESIYQNNNNIIMKLYERNLTSEFNKILWIGEGIFNQRLFYADGKDDLKKDEAYLTRGNRGIIIKVVNHE